MTRIAVYQATFDPPTLYHRRIASELTARFDRVIIAPCGPRPNKSAIPDSRPVHRATLVDLNFGGIEKVDVDLSDLEMNRFAPPSEIASRHGGSGIAVWYVVSSDWVRGGGEGASIIHREWHDGARLWNTAGFVILRERGEPLSIADLPVHYEFLEQPPHLPSNTVRQMLNTGEPVTGHLHKPVDSYISRQLLYRDVHTDEVARLKLGHPQLQVVYDEMNPRARERAQFLAPFIHEDPNIFVTVGGDGTMLRAIRRHWRERRPFFGINTGGLGFLLNGRELTPFWEHDLYVYQLPLLRVEAEFIDGSTADGIAFNDTWVERATGQTAWVRVIVNGVERVPRLIGDGILVSTAAGSSSYARAMGATPVPLNTAVMILVGSNVLKPTFWRPVVLPLDAEVTLETVDPVRRPLLGFLDSEAYPQPIRRLKIRASRTAAVELAYLPEHDPVAKLGFVQFPREMPD